MVGHEDEARERGELGRGRWGSGGVVGLGEADAGDARAAVEDVALVGVVSDLEALGDVEGVLGARVLGGLLGLDDALAAAVVGIGRGGGLVRCSRACARPRGGRSGPRCTRSSPGGRSWCSGR